MNCLTNNKNKRGFSLIELMVVVAIMGILASIGIPQYLEYRDTAAYGRLGTELGYIERAFQTCISSKNVNQCDSQAELGLNDIETGPDGNAQTMAPVFNITNNSFCMDIERTIGGVDVFACVRSDALGGSSDTTINRRFCVNDGGAYHATNNPTRTVAATIAGDPTNCRGVAPQAKYDCLATWDTTCNGICGDTRVLNEPCTNNQECTNLGFDYCSPAGQTGQCTAGMCG